jgi:2-dehydropantoate 2-reductase
LPFGRAYLLLSAFMKIAIVGSGAVGCYYGARLQRAGHDVRFLMRGDLSTVLRDGLQVRVADGDFHLPQVSAFATTAEIGPVDLVVNAMKTTANGALEALVPPLLGPDTAILTLQNGLGSEDEHARLFGPERVLGGLCFVCINRVAPGIIQNTALGSVGLGEFQRPAGPRTHLIAEAFRGAGVKCEVTDDLALMRWKKLCWNVPFNGLSIAAGGITTDRIVGHDGLRKLARDLIQEVIEAAAKLGHTIPGAFGDLQIERTYPMGPYKPSSLIDYLEGREVEVEAIWGEPLRQAQAAGAAVPRLEALAVLLRSLTSRAAEAKVQTAAPGGPA